jgi:hypothetical protein
MTPFVTLNNGVRMPILGLGVAGGVEHDVALK